MLLLYQYVQAPGLQVLLKQQQLISSGEQPAARRHGERRAEISSVVPERRLLRLSNDP